MDNLKRTSGCVYSLKYHLVWCPKYRRSVLTGKVADSLKRLLYQKAEAVKVDIEALEIMPDHVHLFVSARPTDSPDRLANLLKGFTSHALRKAFPWLKSRFPALWSRSYYVGSVGHVEEETVRRYIEAQKGT